MVTPSQSRKLRNRPTEKPRLGRSVRWFAQAQCLLNVFPHDFVSPQISLTSPSIATNKKQLKTHLAEAPRLEPSKTADVLQNLGETSEAPIMSNSGKGDPRRFQEKPVALYPLHVSRKIECENNRCSFQFQLSENNERKCGFKPLETFAAQALPVAFDSDVEEARL